MVIEVVVRLQRALNYGSLRLTIPNIQTPGVLRSQVNCLIAGAVQVELEARPVGYDSRGGDGGPTGRVWIFLVLPLCVAQLKALSYFRSHMVPVVDRTGNERTFSELRAPNRQI